MAGIHHRGFLGEIARRGDVVGDVEARELAVPLEVAEQIENAEPHRDVEHRGRLVRQQNGRIDRQGAGDGDALALSAADSSCGRRVEKFLAADEADLLQQRLARGDHVLAGEFGTMEAQGALEMIADRAGSGLSEPNGS